MPIVTTTEKGQVVIPADIRKRYRITKGTKLAIYEKGDEIVIKPLPSNPVTQARGLFKGGDSALRSLLADRSEEALR